jgi:hypothetical protein
MDEPVSGIELATPHRRITQPFGVVVEPPTGGQVVALPRVAGSIIATGGPCDRVRSILLTTKKI